MEWKLSYDNCKWRHFQQTGFQTTTSILYKIKSISLGVEYIHNPKPNRTYASIKNFSFEEETKWNNFKNLIAVNFTYYLQKEKGIIREVNV